MSSTRIQGEAVVAVSGDRSPAIPRLVPETAAEVRGLIGQYAGRIFEAATNGRALHVAVDLEESAKQMDEQTNVSEESAHRQFQIMYR